jgi:hypothetical protein
LVAVVQPGLSHTYRGTVIMSEVLYYIEDFSDEFMPCAPHPEAWAEWLSKPAEEIRDHPVEDGARFKTTVMRLGDDIVATRGPDGWSFSRDVGDATFLAVRWAQGLAWGPDNILWGEDMSAALREWFADPDNAETCEDVEYVAVGYDEPDVMLVYRAGNPPRMEIETIQ